MRQLTVISGKGGTGKTTITASLAALADNCIAVDCDVDAPNYHLLQKVQRLHQESVVLGQVPVIDSHQCSQCGLCASTCRFHGIDPGPPLRVDPYFCEGCGLCKEICPVGAITMVHDVRGLVITSRISTGILYHAELPPGGENSGKLVSILRNRAREAGRTSDTQMIIADGPPGIGCPVIASITGAHDVLIVTEPGVSALHDLKRAAELARNFSITPMVCINRWDVSPEGTRDIRRYIDEVQAEYVGSVRFDPGLERAQWEECAPVTLDTPASADLAALGGTILTTRRC